LAPDALQLAFHSYLSSGLDVGANAFPSGQTHGKLVLMEPLLIAIAKGDRELTLLPEMANRHGFIAGATGTGKTVTLQVIAEKLSAIGAERDSSRRRNIPAESRAQDGKRPDRAWRW
jgi:Cdc6-like AAA superfamily ATPase